MSIRLDESTGVLTMPLDAFSRLLDHALVQAGAAAGGAAGAEAEAGGAAGAEAAAGAGASADTAGAPVDVSDLVAAGVLDAAGAPHELVSAYLTTILSPVVHVEIVVAGPAARLTHGLWMTPDLAVITAQVDPDTVMLFGQQPAGASSALVRLLRLGPRDYDPRREDGVAVTVPASRIEQLVDGGDEQRQDALRALELVPAGSPFAAFRLIAGLPSADHGRVARRLAGLDTSTALHWIMIDDDTQEATVGPVLPTEMLRLLNRFLAVDEADLPTR